MRINSIDLLNFGSYEKSHSFDVKINGDGRNIILIGGKNGAGKTTLFTAIRLCLYGYKSFGYQSTNAFYNRTILKLFNNVAKLSKPAESLVKLNFSINNGQEFDNYILQRKWELNKDNELQEFFTVEKNQSIMDANEMQDFEKYLMSILPPELFNLYFFDGEKIADFFLEEGSNTRIKNAFLTLCGYDTFEIMSKNFKRLNSSATKQIIVDKYLIAKEENAKSMEKAELLKHQLSLNILETEKIESEITKIDHQYKSSGGVTQKIWNEQFDKIKAEENKRDEKNSWLKKMANETIPFLILNEQLRSLQAQIEREIEFDQIEYFTQQLHDEETKKIILKTLKDNGIATTKTVLSNVIYDISTAKNRKIHNFEKLLMLSSEQISEVQVSIRRILQFDRNEINKANRFIKNSIKKSKQIREELEKCNIDTVSDYVKNKNSLLEQKDKLINERFIFEDKMKEAELEVAFTQNEFIKTQKEYEEELKKNSINDISSKAILFLDKLQERLYVAQIDKVKKTFNIEINRLISKVNFIDFIDIDSNFNIKIYRDEEFTKMKLLGLLKNLTDTQIAINFGEKAFEQLTTLKKKSECKTFLETINNHKNSKVVLSIEVDKNSLSNGEKQIYIMALYKSLISLCKYEVPFVIDTPFARIDTEHRKNIAEHFFKKLKGQVFILSTNEEINGTHIDILSEKISHSFMLENEKNKMTKVTKNKYFEVK